MMPPRALLRLICLVSVGTASPALARLEVVVSHVGFPAIGQGDIIRAGCWTPIYVDISLVGQPSFDGTLRTTQLDTDGDQAFDSVEIHLRAETGGQARAVLYVPANPVAANSQFHVEVRDQDGAVVQVVSGGMPTTRAAPPDPPNVVSHDDLVVLSVSDGAIGKVKDLAGGQHGTLRQTVHVAHIAPSDLPEHWIGLDGVDYIVWEAAKPENLTPRQISALLEWCQFGGTLLIAASDSSLSFSQVKPLASVLPMTVSEVVSVTQAVKTREKLVGVPAAEKIEVGQDWLQTGFSKPVPLAVGRARENAAILAREVVESTSQGYSDVVTSAFVGQGRLIFCGIKLHDLFSAPGAAHVFFERLFHLLPATNQQIALTPVSMYDNVAGAVGFIRSRSAYIAISFLFALGYVVAACWGTWAFLSARGWRQHSWSAFAVVALLAGLGAAVAVGAARGITDRLQQIAVIDAGAGESFGRATVLFGLKSGIDKHADLWLPPDYLRADKPESSSCSLRPLPAGADWRGDIRFTDPVSYQLRPASGEVAGARWRATLKRFEGRWEGPLGGQVTGQIAVRDRFLTESSYIESRLGVELTQCRLIHTRIDPGGIASDRSNATYVYAIDGTIPGDGTRVNLYERCVPAGGSQKLADVFKGAELRNQHREWSRHFSGLMARLTFQSSDTSAALGREKDALMLLSTIGDFDPAVLPAQFGGGFTLSRDRLRQLDLREHLTAGRSTVEGVPHQHGTMVLVGFVQGGGPIRLFARSGDDPYEPIQPEADGSWCMYRIRLPFMDLDAVQAASEGG